MSPMMQRAIAEIHELNETQITRVLQLIADMKAEAQADPGLAEVRRGPRARARAARTAAARVQLGGAGRSHARHAPANVAKIIFRTCANGAA